MKQVEKTMERRKNNWIKAVIMTILAILLLTACAQKSENQTPLAIAVVLGNHANGRINPDSTAFRENVRKAVETGGFISVVVSDGNPELAAEDLYTGMKKYQKGTKEKVESNMEAVTAKVLSGMSLHIADDPEVDTLKALQIALRSLNDASEGSEKILFVIDSGLSTTGVLNFRNNLLDAPPETIVTLLKERDAIPDFHGTRVIWQNMGDTDFPQAPLNDIQRGNLEKIWKAIVEAGQGIFEPNAAMYHEGAEVTYPEVSAVVLPEEEPIVFKSNAVTEEMDFQTPVILSEEQIRFLGDLAEYADKEQAHRILKPIAEYMEAHPDLRMLLIGTTAGDSDNDFTRMLSYERAEAVRDTLVSFGIEEKRFDVLGLACTDPWHVYGIPTSSEAAAVNRKTVLLDANSKEAKRLLADISVNE